MCPAQQRLWTKIHSKFEGKESNLSLYFSSSKNSNFKSYNYLFCVKLNVKRLTWNLFFCRNEIVECVFCTLLWFVTRTVTENILSSLSSIYTCDAQELSKAYSFGGGNTVCASGLFALVQCPVNEWGWQLLSQHTNKERETIDIFNQEHCLPPNTWPKYTCLIWKGKTKNQISESEISATLLYCKHSRKFECS